MSELVLPESVVHARALEVAQRVRDGVNSALGRDCLKVKRVTAVDQQACIVWDDDRAAEDDELKAIYDPDIISWDSDEDVDNLIRIVIAGAEYYDDVVDE